MTFRPDDLTPNLAPAPAPDVGFRQGTIVTWNTSNGNNTVAMGGAVLTNVPILNTGEAIALKEGNTVGLIRFQTSYFILGRITVPGDADFASAAVQFANGYNETDSWNITTTPTVRASVTLSVPSWADEALVWAASTAGGLNTRAVTDYLGLRTRIDGVQGYLMYGSADAAHLANATSIYTRLYSPGSTITVESLVWANGGTWTATAPNEPFNFADITAVAVFRNVI